MSVIAEYWQKEDDSKVRCLLCPHRCLIKPGSHGRCLIRKNTDGMLIQSSYGQVASASLDPIEKKPLYHFHPSSQILSIGTHGCNMACRFCQNWQLSTMDGTRQETTPESLVKIALENNSIGIAYTYNEPLIWFEFVRDCAKTVRQAGLKNVIISNGMINKEPLAELTPYLDAANIDLKGFTQKFYGEHGGYLETVKETITALSTAKIHVEITNLVIPGKNDDIETFKQMCGFIASLSPDIPLHLSRYFPQHQYNIPPTPNNTLTELAKTAKNYLNYVYIGNTNIPGYSDTLCPKCSKLLIERSGYQTKLYTDKNICPGCSASLPFCF
ncbi:MAG: AmmeMemoRadiSam system radical SAM enzyme [Deferribacterales bacterium]